MRVNKWTKYAVVGTLMGTCFTAGVYAQDVLERVDAYLRKDFQVVVDGKQVALANPPLIYNNTSYLPVKELGTYLGAIVNWKESNKTIYVNSRKYPEQTTGGTDTQYTEIVLQSPYAQYFTYLGAQYPVLINMTDQGYFYRLKDVKRMGVDVDGLHLAKEKYTGDFYVNEKELKPKWQETPQPAYVPEPVVFTEEEDDLKRKAISDYIEGIRNYEINKVSYSTTPIIIDALPEENTYDFLMSENGHFFRTKLKLTKTIEINSSKAYTVGSTSKEDIQASKLN